MSNKLTKSQREQLIFEFLKTGKPNPLYDIQETKYGKWIVKPKPVQVEEEEAVNEPRSGSELAHEEPAPVGRADEVSDEYDSEEESSDEEEELIRHAVKAKTTKRKRVKQNAKRILDALTNLINSSDDSSDDETPRAPPLVEQNNYNPGPLTFRRRRLVF